MSDSQPSTFWESWRRGGSSARPEVLPPPPPDAAGRPPVGPHRTVASAESTARASSDTDDDAVIERCRQDIQAGRQTLQARTRLVGLLAGRERLDEAVMEARRAVMAHPGRYQPFAVLAETLRRQDRLVEAVWAAERAIGLAPEAVDAHQTLSLVLTEVGRASQALDHARRVVRLSPNNPLAYANLVHINLEAGDADSALAVVEAAKSRGLISDGLLWNESLARLAAGDLAGGWDLYEYGFTTGLRKPARQLPIPRWSGEDLEGRTILVWLEQGLGDEVRFLTCVPDAIAQGATVVIDTRPRLVSLLRRTFPDADVRPWSGSDVGREPDLDGIDLHAPVGDLARYFRRRPESFAVEGPVFVPDPALVDTFEQRLRAIGTGPTIGVAWRSGNLRTMRLSGYLTLDELYPMVDIDGAHLINLQYGDASVRDRELRDFEERTGAVVHRWADVDYTNDLESIAALTAALDAVVGPASFPTDLAGVLGVPTVRLTRATGPDSIARLWSPSVQIVSRGTDRGWNACVEQVRDAVLRIIGGEA